MPIRNLRPNDKCTLFLTLAQILHTAFETHRFIENKFNFTPQSLLKKKIDFDFDLHYSNATDTRCYVVFAIRIPACRSEPGVLAAITACCTQLYAFFCLTAGGCDAIIACRVGIAKKGSILPLIAFQSFFSKN